MSAANSRTARRRILIPIDHKWRDLPATVVLKQILERKYGHEVILCRQGSELEFAIAYLPHCVVFPHILDDQKVEFSRRLKRMGISLVLYPTEGIPSLRRIYEFYSGKFVDMSTVDVQLCWGEGAKEIYLRYGTVPEQKLRVIGPSRFDFYKPPINRLIPSREEIFRKYGLDPAKPVILWTTNFVKASIYEADREFYKQDFRNYKLQSSFPDPDASARKDLDTRAMMAEFFARLAGEVQANLLIKHHPMESPGYFREKAAAMSGGKSPVALVRDNYIWDVIPYADVIVQRSCTTGLEAFFLGKPVLEMQVNPDDKDYVNEELDGCSDLIPDYPTFIAAVRRYLGGGPIPAEQQERRRAFIDKWCHRIDGKNTERLAEFLDGHVRGQSLAPKNIRDKTWFKLRLRNAVYRALGAPYYLPLSRLLSRREPPDSIGRHDKWVKVEDIAEWEGKVAGAFPGRAWDADVG